MNRIVCYTAVAVFSVFLGSQITEAIVLVPYWKTLSSIEFYTYYSSFGPNIARYYTLLTVVAALAPIGVCIYCAFSNSRALKYAIVSTAFTLLFIALFYVYFKGTNQQLYQATLPIALLQSTLKTWSFWHWIRVVLELFSLVFLISALNVLNRKEEVLL